VTWHLIGNLQRRKVKNVINFVDYFHALDSVKLAEEINKRAEHKIKCFAEVNISGEESKHGFTTDELKSSLTALSALENVEIVGLMTMAPFDATEAECEDIFRQMKKLQVEISEMKLANISCTELSMGMSRDYQTAIKSGATFVRIGTEFFKNL
jgi:pyridoxal phosphate enzyme (YggS family)